MPPRQREPVIAVDRVGKRFGRHIVLEEVSLNLDAGECLGVIGPNGAGKTTILRMLVGLLAPSEGQIHIGGLAPQIAVPLLPVLYFGGERVMPRSMRAKTWARLVSGVDLSEMSSVNGMSRRKLGKLSSGNRQMIGLRVTLAGARSPVVILDEPWEHLDPDGSRWLARRIEEMRAVGTTLVLSSHRLHDLAGLCDLYGFLVAERLQIRSRDDLSPRGPVEAEHLYRAYDEISTSFGGES